MNTRRQKIPGRRVRLQALALASCLAMTSRAETDHSPQADAPPTGHSTETAAAAVSPGSEFAAFTSAYLVTLESQPINPLTAKDYQHQIAASRLSRSSLVRTGAA